MHDGTGENDFVAMRKARDATLDMSRLILPSLQVNMRAGHMPPEEDNGRVYLKLPINAFKQVRTLSGNLKRHQVETSHYFLPLRVDESLYFAKASYREEEIFRNLAERKSLRHVILMRTAVNEIENSALEGLESSNDILKEQSIGLHLSDVKSPVMHHFEGTHFLSALNGQVFLSHYQAVQTLLLEDTLLPL